MGIKKIISESLFALMFFYNRSCAQTPVYKEAHHKLIYENAYVRLLDGRIRAGDTTAAHTHTINSVIIFLSKSTFAIQNSSGKPVTTTVSPGDLVYRTYGDGPITHRVWNAANPAFHFMVVELLRKNAGKNICRNLPGTGIKLQWQEPPVNAYIVNIARSKHFKILASTCGYLLIDITGNITAGYAGNGHALCAGQFAFFQPQQGIYIKNNSPQNAHCVVLQLQ